MTIKMKFWSIQQQNYFRFLQILVCWPQQARISLFERTNTRRKSGREEEEIRKFFALNFFCTYTEKFVHSLLKHVNVILNDSLLMCVTLNWHRWWWEQSRVFVTNSFLLKTLFFIMNVRISSAGVFHPSKGKNLRW